MDRDGRPLCLRDGFGAGISASAESEAEAAGIWIIGDKKVDILAKRTSTFFRPSLWSEGLMWDELENESISASASSSMCS